jgi:hypothetical protein
MRLMPTYSNIQKQREEKMRQNKKKRNGGKNNGRMMRS